LSTPKNPRGKNTATPFMASLEDELHPYIGLGFERNCKENLLDGAVLFVHKKPDEEKLVLEIK